MSFISWIVSASRRSLLRNYKHEYDCWWKACSVELSVTVPFLYVFHKTNTMYVSGRFQNQKRKKKGRIFPIPRIKMWTKSLKCCIETRWRWNLYLIWFHNEYLDLIRMITHVNYFNRLSFISQNDANISIAYTSTSGE